MKNKAYVSNDVPPIAKNPSLYEIKEYFTKNQKDLGLTHYRLILSRLAHIKGAEKDVYNEIVNEVSKEITPFRFDVNTKMLSDIIKYCSLTGCKNKKLWNKLINSIYKSDYSNNLYDLAKTVNYLNKSHIKSSELWEEIQ